MIISILSKPKVCAFLAMLCAGMATYSYYRFIYVERARLKANQELLLQSNKALRLDSAKHVSELKTLNLTVSEFKRANTELISALDSMNISSKRVCNASVSSYSGSLSVHAPLKDSVVKYVDTVHDTVQVYMKKFKYTSPYNTVNGVVNADSVHLTISSVDTIYNVVSYEPYRFLFGLIKFGKKHIKCSVHNANPNSYIVVKEAYSLSNK